MTRQATRGDRRRSDAVHEAAHAVVAVRLGLPLAFTNIRTDPNRADPYGLGREGVAVGYTTLEPGAAEAWVVALPDPGARAALEALAAQNAAGIVADLHMGLETGDPSHQNDAQGIVQIAGALGLGENSADPAVAAFMKAAVERAANLLSQDGGAAWDRVSAALFKRRRLTGRHVAALVG